jgi:crossover junction endodeoxyribonuclease RusA
MTTRSPEVQVKRDPALPLHVMLPWPPKELSPNARVHFFTLARAKKRYRTTAYVAALEALRGQVLQHPGPFLVWLEFSPPAKSSVRARHDEDNLVARMKAGLDGVAEALRVDDKQFRLEGPRIVAAAGNGGVSIFITTAEGGQQTT